MPDGSAFLQNAASPVVFVLPSGFAGAGSAFLLSLQHTGSLDCCMPDPLTFYLLALYATLVQAFFLFLPLFQFTETAALLIVISSPFLRIIFPWQQYADPEETQKLE